MNMLIAQRNLQDAIHVDSAGTGAWHLGELADPRSRQCAHQRGIKLTSQARQITRKDFDRFHYLLALDQSNQQDLLDLAPSAMAHKIHLLRNFDPQTSGPADVPDPYYGGPRGFDDVFDICLAACTGLLEHLCRTYSL